MSNQEGKGMGVTCSICGVAIGETWVEVIVRDKMGDDFIERVGFLDSSECLVAYAKRVEEG